MNNLISLLKINFSSFFNISKTSSDHKKSRSSMYKLILVLLLLVYFGFYIYKLGNMMMKGFMVLNISYLLPVLYMVICSTFVLFTNIYKCNGLIFNFKDYDLLFSMPIKKETVIISKFLTLYCSNLLIVLLFMIPAFIVYISYIPITFLFVVFYTLSIFIIPIIPIVVAVLLGTTITFLTSRFKHKNIFYMLLNLVLFLGIFYFSYAFENKSAVDIANIGNTLIDKFNSIYPFTALYTSIIKDISFSSLIVFLIVSIALFILCIKVVGLKFKIINSNLKTSINNKNYKFRNVNRSSEIIALYKKEIKRYLSSPNYILNTAMGSILLVMGVIALLFIGSDKLSSLIGMGNIAASIKAYGPLILGIFCALNCSTYASISLESHNLWILKVSPIKTMNVFMSKVMVNLTILIPTIVVTSSILSLYFNLSITSYLLMLFVPIMYAFFISFLGLILNINFPDFEWKNELKVIKQSFASFLTIFIGILAGIFPLLFEMEKNPRLYNLLVGIVLLFINLILYIYLAIIGVKKFRKL